MRTALALTLSATTAGGASNRVAVGAMGAPGPPRSSSGGKGPQAEGDQVPITLGIDRKAFEIGVLPAATETEPGTPATCALRSAHAMITELTCGDMTSWFAAELAPDALVISRVDGGTRTELQRIPVYAGSLAVSAFRMPTVR